MKALLEFELPMEREDFETCQKGWLYKQQLEDVWQNVFRPYHKHGYSNQEITELLENDENCRRVFLFLESVYREIVNGDA